MALGGITGKGCKFAYSAASPVAWLQVEQLADMSIPTQVADRIANDMHSSTSNLHQYLAGMDAVGDPTATFVADFDPATAPRQEALRLLQASKETVWIRQEVPVNSAKTLFRGWIYQAKVANWEPATPINDRETIKFTFMFAGSSIQVDAASGATAIT